MVVGGAELEVAEHARANYRLTTDKEEMTCMEELGIWRGWLVAREWLRAPGRARAGWRRGGAGGVCEWAGNW